MITCGIDPGLSGAIAFYEQGYVYNIWDIPTFDLVRNGKKKREIDEISLARLLDRVDIDHVWLEQVSSMPKQGVSSVFSFGQTFGIIKGIIAAFKLPMTLITPAVWKKALKVPASKDGARARASQLIPGGATYWPLVKHDGRAEAALIAYYGATHAQ